MSRRVIAYGFGFMWLSLFTLLNGCGSVCQRCAPDRPVERAASTTPSRAVQELLAQRTWAAFVEQRAVHEARALQVAALEAEHDRVTHLPRVSLQIGTPIPLATAMRLLLAETGYSVVYGSGVDPHQLVSASLVHQRLDAASDALVRPLGYHVHLNSCDRQVQIAALMTGRWRVRAEEQDEAWWNVVRTTLEQAITSNEQKATTSNTFTPRTQPHAPIIIDRSTGSIVVSAPVQRMDVIDAYLSGLGAERLDEEEE